MIVKIREIIRDCITFGMHFIYTRIYQMNIDKIAKADTYIGKRCFIGVNAIIMCGVKVNDNVIVGSGSVVTKDIPANCIVAGNPARIIKEGIQTKKFGQLMQQS